jgi:hemerythrin
MDDTLITWDDQFLVNCAIIDQQHRGLVDMTNELIQGCKRGNIATDVVFMKTIRKAIDYAQVHFSSEEKYMRQAAYPDLTAHQKEHEIFVAEIIKQVKAFEEDRNDPGELVEFLKNWLLNHIAVSDKKYAPYLAGLEAAVMPTA